MELSFRQATKDDLDRILEVHLAAFPDPRGVEERRRGLSTNPLGGLERFFVAVADGTIVGQAFLFELETFFGGRAVKTGGIASVGVAPEARGRGVATALLAELHRRADAEGAAITLLYAFRQGFYARLGYGATSPRRRLVVDPRAIPRAWASRGVRAPREGDRERLVEAFLREAARGSGWLVRPSGYWDRLFARERRQILMLDGAETSYVAFELVQEVAHAETVLVVDEIVAHDEEARRALFGALAAMRDQAARIVVEVALDDPIDLALLDADKGRFGDADVEHDLGTVVGGPMVRVVDVARAVEARGYRGDAAFGLRVDGALFTVRIAGGAARVRPGELDPTIRTNLRGLGTLLYGGAAPSALGRVGLVSAPDTHLATLDPVLRIPPLLPLDAF